MKPHDHLLDFLMQETQSMLLDSLFLSQCFNRLHRLKDCQDSKGPNSKGIHMQHIILTVGQLQRQCDCTSKKTTFAT